MVSSALILATSAIAITPEQRAKNLASFELVWSTLGDRYWDASMGGLDWKVIGEQYRREMNRAETMLAARGILDRMIHLLPSSHLAIIPASLYKASSVPLPKAPEGTAGKHQSSPPAETDKEDDDSGWTGIHLEVIEKAIVVAWVDPQSPAAKRMVQPGWTIISVSGVQTEALYTTAEEALARRIVESWLSGPPGSKTTVVFKTPESKLITEILTREAEPGSVVRFGNLPPEHVYVGHKLLGNGVGYLKLNLFLDPMTVMPEIEKTISEFRQAPGIVLDLRDNPGGIGVMAMGIAGWFVEEEGTRLGTMTSRDSTLNFVINPRPQPYAGQLAMLVNQGSASTSEILAQGLKDLGRARIFGTRTAGAALPSNIIELPDGDRFQYPDANYVSMHGRILEGNGVEPDVVVTPTIKALSTGRDLPLEAAEAWCGQK